MTKERLVELADEMHEQSRIDLRDGFPLLSRRDADAARCVRALAKLEELAAADSSFLYVDHYPGRRDNKWSVVSANRVISRGATLLEAIEAIGGGNG